MYCRRVSNTDNITVWRPLTFTYNFRVLGHCCSGRPLNSNIIFSDKFSVLFKLMIIRVYSVSLTVTYLSLLINTYKHLCNNVKLLLYQCVLGRYNACTVYVHVCIIHICKICMYVKPKTSHLADFQTFVGTYLICMNAHLYVGVLKIFFVRNCTIEYSFQYLSAGK